MKAAIKKRRSHLSVVPIHYPFADIYAGFLTFFLAPPFFSVGA